MKYERPIFSKLSEVYPNIATVKEFDGVLFILYEDQRVLFFVMGDGFQAAFRYLSLLLANEKTIILCEEPENYQHPASRKLVVNGICGSAKRNQRMNSTHSLEFLDELMVEAENAGICVNFFHLSPNLEAGGLTYRSFDRAKAVELRELNL